MLDPEKLNGLTVDLVHEHDDHRYLVGVTVDGVFLPFASIPSTDAHRRQESGTDATGLLITDENPASS